MSGAETFDERTGLEIAIVGMAGRFPGARSVEEFWRNLRDGAETISRFTDEELLGAGLRREQFEKPNYVPVRGILDDIEMFDASFFGFTPREAEITDPQQRLFLEASSDALERAGYDPETYKGAIGVFAGVGADTYLLFNLYSNAELIESAGTFAIIMANHKDSLTTRVSYKLNLRGPSVTVQTACSTSLVAVHLACQSLLGGECDMALAGGVSVTIPQKTGYEYQQGGILSPDGHCRTFDARADGTIGSNGLGVVVLKKLEDALADGDHIHAVIKGSAINNDGSQKVGYTAPSVEAQAQAIRAAHAVAGVAPDTITYVECHGTATSLGDPVEVAALTQAFRAETQARNFCAVGSLKSNVGHLDTAAGVGGLIKTALALEHRLIPPSLHFESPNPQIDFENSPFYVNDKLSDWNSEGPRRAGVSSFGIGGTNAHVVLEEAPAQESSPSPRSAHLFVLSARTEAALERATANLAAHLKERPELDAADVAYTLQVGRRAHGRRRALVCRDAADAVAALEARDPKRMLEGVRAGGKKVVVFMFPGQGAQHAAMGAGLYREEEIFREEIDRCAEILRPSLGLDLRTLLFPEGGREEEAARELRQTRVAQPALFAVEYALARLWMEWGVRPDAMIGHSVGEYTAACLAGVLSPEDALALLAERGRLVQEQPGGAMLAVPLAEDDVTAFLDERLSVAAVNAPSLTVVSGSEEAVAELERRLDARGTTGHRLHTSHAFHSAMMEPVLEPFAARVRRVTLRPPQIPYVSNVTGTWVQASDVTEADYWAAHLRRPVRFSEGVRELLKEPSLVLLEVGPGRTLGGLVERHPEKSDAQVGISSMRHPNERHSDMEQLLAAVGKLWCAGYAVEWPKLHARERRRRVGLPTYPFERKRFWVERLGAAEAAGAGDNGHAAHAPSKAAGNGHAHAPQVAAATTPADEVELERIMRQQLQVLAQQLELLRDVDLGL
ncbi:MAG TPA: type I polyketide synthase [Pyrinomonadaceae bacterium]|nr:type I polyketide synthase [Pyrinomonadaceae bacterium]